MELSNVTYHGPEFDIASPTIASMNSKPTQIECHILSGILLMTDMVFDSAYNPGSEMPKALPQRGVDMRIARRESK